MSAEQGVRVCRQCEEAPAVPGAVSWWCFLPFYLWLTGGPSADAYCRKCAGGINFMGILASLAIFAVAFVLLVVFW